jgi:hypothetical protein
MSVMNYWLTSQVEWQFSQVPIAAVPNKQVIGE